MKNSDDPKSNKSKMTKNETSTEETTEHSNKESPVEVMPGLEELLKKSELVATEHLDAWLRAKADSENIR